MFSHGLGGFRTFANPTSLYMHSGMYAMFIASGTLIVGTCSMGMSPFLGAGPQRRLPREESAGPEPVKPRPSRVWRLTA